MGRHQKRVASPASWHIDRKAHVWVVGSNAGPHSKNRGIPLLLIIRDILKLAKNSKEAKRIIYEGKIYVDGVPRKNYKYVVGLFDILSIPELDEYYRVLFDSKNRLKLHKVEKDAKKLCRINNKTILKHGIVQLNLHDGGNVIGSNEYKTLDSIILSLPDKTITKHIKYKVGAYAMIIGGKHSGEIGTIKKITKVRGSGNNLVELTNESDFETIEDYVFVIGENASEIKVI